MKNPLTLAGIEPATFRFVAQRFNHCATAVPHTVVYNFEISVFACTAALYQSRVLAKGASLEATADRTEYNVMLVQDILLCLKYSKKKKKAR